MENEIKIDNLSKNFGNLHALHDISLDLKGGMHIVLGPNGAGKSTLLKCIDGHYKLDRGYVRVNGLDPYTNDKIRDKMSILSDNYSLYDELTVIDNLKFFGRLYGLKDKEILENVSEFLNEFDAARYLKSKVSTLSRGTKQKIAFCRALINKPEILLLDEPTAFLDSRSSQLMHDIMQEYSKNGRIVLFVTQKLDEISRFNSELIILRAGTVSDVTTTSNIYSTILKDTIINIRLASGFDPNKVKGIPNLYNANNASPNFIKVKIKNYKDINDTVAYLIENGGYVIGVDYIEPLIESLSFG
ncbi:ABC2-1 family ABC transporter ATPase [Candidatus Mancarchaeum acidiphilum]|uniref:ABC2-1 family ABC transporter ATPase n=1 Tax=Candidatus Mancarchaeum acidiphilum TaxID=1920749 RepID=A0A218NP84_9ARCH|nr:ABC transporter ATP-binding protein [Candidatus Mancarchaeum acidiphilum]ASI14280.1 ABC2-1 family ABC transporter ATPase [Candidatus Mancarchaeum acidiphilum]